MKNIVVVDTKQYERQRIKELMEPMNVKVLEASGSTELLILLKNAEELPALMVLDMNLNEEDGFSVMRMLKKNGISIPVILLTMENKRDSFIRGIKEGAVDYMLKPFQDEELKLRIIKHMNIGMEEDSLSKKGLTLNFQQYLEGELKKSKKGKYNISILMTTFVKKAEANIGINEKEYYLYQDRVYDTLSKLFWDTDVFVKYGSQSFIGIFPFSDEVNTQIVVNKINDSFEKLKKEDKQFSTYSISSVYVTSPLEGLDKETLIERLLEKTKGTP
ncbi:MAG TPA: response regulator [Clostridiaceae bacterium]